MTKFFSVVVLSSVYIRVRHIFLDFKVSRCIEVYSFLGIWGWDSQQGRVRATSILVQAFWNFKLKVLKYSRNCCLQYTMIPNFWHPLVYMYVIIVILPKLYWSSAVWFRCNKKMRTASQRKQCVVLHVSLGYHRKWSPKIVIFALRPKTKFF